MRIIQPKGTKGSLKWIQAAVDRCPEVLQPRKLPTIEWVSPLEEDDYAEYRDAAFLNRLGIGHLTASLKDFWPQRGPQWDALGLTSHGPVLVEAKAHIREFFSPPSQAGQRSREQINRAFATVRADLGIGDHVNWSELYYQYANRLAFLWWLREHGVDAKLLFVSFLNDSEMGGPQHAETWDAAFAAADYALGLPRQNKLRSHIYHVTPDVREISHF
ncbi:MULTISPECIES: hypothetical protein [unclassified Ruegeria]|uniref:hypothetical protein n=1 Tax=unclassified Ruegeria TaxID=2625375 RepID=UPI00147D7582|nr:MULTISPECIES: hypothetical protein [unclassified Ruegeria]